MTNLPDASMTATTIAAWLIIQPNILFTVHEGTPFCRWQRERSQPTPKGRPFIMRLRQRSNPVLSVLKFFAADSRIVTFCAGR
jgi:hypothetical protein